MVKHNTFIPNTITSNLVEYCIEYGYLCIGINSIGPYHIYQYRGKENYLELFIKQCKKVFGKYPYSIYKKQDIIQKISENDITFIQDKTLIQYKQYNKSLKISIPKKDILFFLSNCYKKNNAYYFIIYYKSIIKGVPKKILYEICFKAQNDILTIYSNSITVLKNIELWLYRLIELHKKL